MGILQKAEFKQSSLNYFLLALLRIAQFSITAAMCSQAASYPSSSLKTVLLN